MSRAISEEDTINSLSIQFDLECHRRELEDEGFLKNLMKGKAKGKRVWDNFDIFDVSEKMARALKAGGFSRIFEFLIDDEYIFVSSDKSKGKSIKEAISLFANESELRKRYKQFRYRAWGPMGGTGTEISVVINRQHFDTEPAVLLKLKGEISLKRCKKLLDQIDRNLSIKNLKSKPSIA